MPLVFDTKKINVKIMLLNRMLNYIVEEYNATRNMILNQFDQTKVYAVMVFCHI